MIDPRSASSITAGTPQSSGLRAANVFTKYDPSILLLVSASFTI
jgi:hypothetical protein